jgi:hypothetical protein
MPSQLKKVREAAGVTQIEASVRARVSPPLCRNFERFGPDAVDDALKRARLVAVYETFRRDIELRGGKAA